MAYDPAKPVEGTLCDAAEMRSQLQGLHTLITGSGVTGAAVDSTTTGAPGTPASASVALTSGVLHFTFTVPEGVAGEVTQAQLSNDLANTANYATSQALAASSANSNGVSLLGLTVSDPPTQSEMQAIANKLDDLINALRR